MAKKFSNPLPQNELLGSVFFAPPPLPKPVAPPDTPKPILLPPIPKPEEITRSSERPNDRTVERTNVRTNGQTKVRLKRRYSFEIYDDQIQRLQHLRLDDLQAGGRGNMSEIVRNAIDAYLDKLR